MSLVYLRAYRCFVKNCIGHLLVWMHDHPRVVCFAQVLCQVQPHRRVTSGCIRRQAKSPALGETWSQKEWYHCRCIVWERTHEATTADRSCEGADDSEIEAAKAAPQLSSQHAPLLVRNQLRSCVSDGIQLVGARKRAASSAGMGSPLKAARESNSTDGTCTTSDIHCMLFGQIQSVQFVVPLD